MIFPTYFYFIGWPFIKYFWLPLLPLSWSSKLGYEPALPVYGPELEQGPIILSWGFTILKWGSWMVVVAAVVLVMIWMKQESILYVPSQPI